MNTLQSKLARLKIKGRKYFDKRWEKMIEEAEHYELRANFCRDKQFREKLFHKEMMYRKRAAWYIIQITRKKVRR